MAHYQSEDPEFRLVPFIQNKTNSISFFLTSPYDNETIINFFIEVEDYTTPDVFFDILTIAVDSLMVNTRARV